MRQKSGPRGTASQKVVKDIRRATRKHYSAEEKIRVVLDGLRGKEMIAEILPVHMKHCWHRGRPERCRR